MRDCQISSLAPKPLCLFKTTLLCAVVHDNLKFYHLSALQKLDGRSTKMSQHTKNCCMLHTVTQRELNLNIFSHSHESATYNFPLPYVVLNDRFFFNFS